MTTEKEVNEMLDEVETKINGILQEYDVSLGMLYDGVAITMNASYVNEENDTVDIEREADFY